LEFNGEQRLPFLWVNLNHLFARIIEENIADIKWLTIEYIKKHSRIDYDCEDDLLELYGNAAEDMVMNTIRRDYDEIVEKFRRREDGLYSVDCSVDFDEFCDYFEIKAESESVSLSGWVTEMLGRIPEENASFTFENLTVTVESMDSHRVAFVTVLRAEKAEEEAKSEE
jgi:Mg2+/Co2+ transporter CorC